MFDTQIAAALAGHPAQVGYAELVRRLLGVELAKAHTRADWSRRPLSPEEQEYALDDVRHLAALRDSLLDTLRAKGRLAWLEEELAALANADALRVDPEDAWKKVKGLPTLDPATPASSRRRSPRGASGARSSATVRAAGSSTTLSLREIVLRLPRSLEALAAAARDAGIRGAQVRRRTAGAGARGRHSGSAAAAAAARTARCRRRSRW